MNLRVDENHNSVLVVDPLQIAEYQVSTRAQEREVSKRVHQLGHGIVRDADLVISSEFADGCIQFTTWEQRSCNEVGERKGPAA